LNMAENPKSDCNHIFMNFIPTVAMSPDSIKETFKGFLERHGKRMVRLRVQSGEIKLNIKQTPRSPSYPIRFVISNVTGFVLNVHAYRETKNERGLDIFVSIAERGPLHGKAIDSPYPTKEWLQPKRYSAHLSGTTYIYDFPELFRQSLQQMWRQAKETDPNIKIPTQLLKAKELVLDEKDHLHEVYRPAGSNTIGMVAWHMEIFTPEFPNGRSIIVIGNDITHVIGSFGPAEDRLFYKSSELARKLGIPRIYLSANSGARIGIAEEVINCFKVTWVVPENPSKGIKYLYLSTDDYQRLAQNAKPSVKAKKVVEDGEERYQITDIIGAADGIGVENLQGSGLIAGETSRAYDDVFTISLVTCRSVGIGAYLVRLGQRTIQNEGNPIILTGASALNKVLGREVYSSNLQIGGTQIMFSNGVSHLVAKDDLTGTTAILKWLSYIPAKKGGPLPIIKPIDPVDREIEFVPTKAPYDPRWMIAGKHEDGKWSSGFFDRDSFTETLGGWARTVVTGRAHLGGIPVGVIAVETRTVEQIVPADPANGESQQQVNQQAGQVWFPDSAFKTAQAINDFNKGEELPLIIFANWRGFSGGQRDMFNEILKYGSYIVDALRNYKQPLFVYIPPNGELRGGAWVVLDSTINPDMMEMYADVDSRGGVLEPEGTVEIKYRKPTLINTMQRLDPAYKALKDAFMQPDLNAAQKQKIKDQMEAREKELLPIYHQIAVQFADLHDTAGRMKEKGVIREELHWKESRKYLYWRLRRRVEEEDIIKKILNVNPSLDRARAHSILYGWFHQDSTNDFEQQYKNDMAVVEWHQKYKDIIHSRIHNLEQDYISSLIIREGEKNRSAVINGLLVLLKNATQKEKEDLLQRISDL